MAEKFLAKSKAQDVARQNGQSPAAEPQPLAGRFWRFAVIFSFAVNVILLVVVVALVAMLFQITNGIATPIVGGLHDSFLEMQSASIVTTIPVNETIVVNDTIPVVFDLPLNQNTTVVTTEPLTINGATVNIQSGGLTLNANADIVLPAGTSLPVQLNLVVPVSQTVPVSLKVPVQITVPVNIPLAQTELNAPFSQLASIVAPYDTMLKGLPTSWSEALLGK